MIEDDTMTVTERLELGDSNADVAWKMSEGNPGALRVIVEMMAAEFDGVSGAMHVLHLDSLGVYSSRIWMLYKDCCGEDYRRMALVLRSWQLGHMSKDKIHAAIDAGTKLNPRSVAEMIGATRPAVTEETA